MDALRSCCITWKDLSIELREAKEEELQLLIQEKGIPKSTFSSLFYILDNMNNCCPCCGWDYRKQLQQPTPTYNAYNITPTKAPEATPTSPTKTPSSVPCPACNATGKAGGIVNSAVKCMKCMGNKIINIPKKVSEEKTMQLEDLKEAARLARKRRIERGEKDDEADMGMVD